MKDKHPLLHQQTTTLAKQYLAAPSQVLLITGQKGTGKYTFARHIASKLLSVPEPELHLYPYFQIIKLQPGKKEIVLDDIRPMLASLRLRTTGKAKVRRVVIIEDADRMNQESQNRLLKTLEAPPVDTVFLLTSSKIQLLIDTLISRSRLFKLSPVSLSSAVAYYKDTTYSQEAIEAAWMLSGGSMGLLDSLLSDQDHPLKKAILDAKQLLRKSAYERVIEVDRLSKDTTYLEQFLLALQKVLSAAYTSNIQRHNNAAGKKILELRKLVIKTQDDLSKSANPKLLTLNLLVKF